MGLTVEQKEIIQQYRDAHKDAYKLSDAQINAIINEHLNEVKLTENDSTSLFWSNKDDAVLDSLDLKSSITINEKNGKYAVKKGGEVKYYTVDGNEIGEKEFKLKDYCELVNDYKKEIAEFRQNEPNAVYCTDVQLAAILANNKNFYCVRCDDLFGEHGVFSIKDNASNPFEIKPDGKFCLYSKDVKSVLYYDKLGRQISYEEYNKTDYSNPIAEQKGKIKTFKKENPQLSFLSDTQILQAIYMGVSEIKVCTQYGKNSPSKTIKVQNKTYLYQYSNIIMEILKNKNYRIYEDYYYGDNNRFDKYGNSIEMDDDQTFYKTDIKDALSFYASQIRQYRAKHSIAKYLTDAQIARIIEHNVDNIAIKRLDGSVIGTPEYDSYWINADGQMFIDGEAYYSNGEVSEMDILDIKCLVSNNKDIINTARKNHKEFKNLTDVQIALILHYKASQAVINSDGKRVISMLEEHYIVKDEDPEEIRDISTHPIIDTDGNIFVPIIDYNNYHDNIFEKSIFLDKNGNKITKEEYFDLKNHKFTQKDREWIADFKKQYPYTKNMTDIQMLAVMKANVTGFRFEYTDNTQREENTPSYSSITTRPSGRFYIDKNGMYLYFEKDGRLMNGNGFLDNEYYAKVRYKSGKEETVRDIFLLKNEELQQKVNNVIKENGLIGKTWDFIKNLFGSNSSSEALRENSRYNYPYFHSLNQQGIIDDQKTFTQETGYEFSTENLIKFKNGEFETKREKAIKEYRNGQDIAVDVVGDVVSGFAAFGAYAFAVAAPFSAAFPPVAVGFAAAAIIGGLVKVGVKSLETATSNKKFSAKQMAKDFVTGAFSGILAPFTGGVGGAAGKGIASLLKIQAVKHFGKASTKTGMEVLAEQGIKNTVKNGIKRSFKQKFTTAMTNPAGYEYHGATRIKRAIPLVGELATGGAVAGFFDCGFRTAIDGGSFEDIKDSALSGALGGAIASPILGGLFKSIGKIFHNKGAKKVDSKGLEKYSDETFKLKADDILIDTNNKYGKKYKDCIQYVQSNENLKYNHEFIKDFQYAISTADYKKLEPDFVKQMITNSEELGITSIDLVKIFYNYEPKKISYKQIEKAYRLIGKNRMSKLSDDEFKCVTTFIDFYEKTNINELTAKSKKTLLRILVDNNSGLFKMTDEIKGMFPLIPTTRDEYCTLLPSIARSLGIATNPITKEAAKKFNSSISFLGKTLAEISDEEFAKLTITQEFEKDEFIRIVLQKLRHLSSKEKQKVFDYFGFELHHNKKNPTNYSITGYPVNLNNGKKLAQIESEETKAVIEALRSDVIRFSEQNKIRCNNPQIEKFLNEVVEVLPELRSMIGRTQHGNGKPAGHDFDVMQHSLKVLQKIVQEPKFKDLNDSDKRIMALTSLLHDITKFEGLVDKTHATESAFDAFYISKKFNLTRDEEIKLYTLVKQHEWLEYVNKSPNEETLNKRLIEVAFRLQNDNLFDLSLMFTHADLKAVKVNDAFHSSTTGRGRVSFNQKGERVFDSNSSNGTVKSYGESADIYAEKIKGFVHELQKSKPLLPVTKFPKASSIRNLITKINSDGSTNIKGVYISKEQNGKELVVIKYNEVENWEALGFPKGTISRGITSEGSPIKSLKKFNTGNIKFFVHGLDWENQLAKFDAFALPDSEVLLSTSYAERVESKFRFFRKQGVILDVSSKYVYGGGYTDSGSGYGKFIRDFIVDYTFGGKRECDRLYISQLIKKATGMSDEDYLRFIKENEDKSMLEIEPAKIRNQIIQAFGTINSDVRKGLRSYNEMYISNPRVMGVFAFNASTEEGGASSKVIKNIMEFISKQKDFLKQYAINHDIPFVVFGD